MTGLDTNDVTFRGRVRATLYGIAYGDAIGGPVEKLSAQEITEKYGRVTSINNRWHRLDEDEISRNGRTRGYGIITDDTLMTICLMEVYSEVNRHIDAWDMAGPFVRKIAWEPRWIPELDKETVLIERLFYPEKWIFHRLQLAACDPRQGGIGNMVNCGAAMYAAPIGIVNACDPVGAYNEAIHFMSGHQQSYGLEAAGVFSACVAEAFRPESCITDVLRVALELSKDGTHDAIHIACEIAKSHEGTAWNYESVVAELHAAMLRYSPMADDLRHGPEKAGVATNAYQPSRLMSIEELPLALAFCILNDGEFSKSVEDSINSGRDTDSIGIMAGAILGAMTGNSVVDTEILMHLNTANKFDICQIADEFSATACSIIKADLSKEKKRRNQIKNLITGDEKVDGRGA